jgi:ferritin-like metal-binding protein YciE
MALSTLRDLFQAELEDLYDAEKQIVAALPKMAAAASAPDLKRAFEKHLDRSRLHVERLDLIFKRLNLASPSRKSAGIEGLIRDGNQRIEQGGEPDTRDAALISAAQRIEHYEMAAYGSARTFARQLGDDESYELLQTTLEEEGAADKELTNLAESGINQAARRGQEIRAQSRLRYVHAEDVERSRLDWPSFKVRNRAGDNLGTIDGAIVDDRGRPVYFVVDSGGWFIGRRYLVPVGKVQRGTGGSDLTVDLDKDTFKRYPEFHSGAFQAMSDEEARRYEWRVLEAIDPSAARKTPGEWRYEEYDFYRAPDWAGVEWTSVGGVSDELRAEEREPLAVGTVGEEKPDPAFTDETQEMGEENLKRRGRKP